MAEARAMISLNHPNICRFFQFDFDQDVDYIVMEYIDGETLRDRPNRSVDFEEFTKIAEQCLQALIEAHGLITNVEDLSKYLIRGFQAKANLLRRESFRT